MPLISSVRLMNPNKHKAKIWNEPKTDKTKRVARSQGNLEITYGIYHYFQSNMCIN